MANQKDHDQQMMLRAISVARGNPSAPFGTVVSRLNDQSVVVEGLNDSKGNPLHHGEIVAINRIVSLPEPPAFDQLCLYTTAEPCPMCLAAILWAGIPRVVYGTTVATLLSKGWTQFKLPSLHLVDSFTGNTCEFVGPVCETECDLLFPSRS